MVDTIRLISDGSSAPKAATTQAAASRNVSFAPEHEHEIPAGKIMLLSNRYLVLVLQIHTYIPRANAFFEHFAYAQWSARLCILNATDAANCSFAANAYPFSCSWDNFPICFPLTGDARLCTHIINMLCNLHFIGDGPFDDTDDIDASADGSYSDDAGLFSFLTVSGFFYRCAIIHSLLLYIFKI